MQKWSDWKVHNSEGMPADVKIDDRVMVSMEDGEEVIDVAKYCYWKKDTTIRKYKVLIENTSDTEVPDTNPKRQYGNKAIPLNLWSPLASAYGALGLYNGGLKYGFSNYKATPVEASIYIAAAMRHLNAWAEGEEYDSADGVPNLGGVLANIAILLDSRANGTLIDDRQIPSGYLKERDALKEIVGKLQELHKDKNPKHYSIKDAKSS